MTAQIQTFLHANPVTTTLSRAARWDQLKVHILDVARGYCFTFHAQRTGQLRVLRVRASKARAAYVAAPGSQHALDEFFYYYFFGWESYSLHIHGHATKETTSVKREAIHSRSCKLPSLLG